MDLNELKTKVDTEIKRIESEEEANLAKDALETRNLDLEFIEEIKKEALKEILSDLKTISIIAEK